jgi:hypothetical protein
MLPVGRHADGPKFETGRSGKSFEFRATMRRRIDRQGNDICSGERRRASFVTTLQAPEVFR